METHKLLLEHFLTWQQRERERKTLKEFATELGMSDKSFNNFFTGRRVPGLKITKQLAEKLDDPRFYDAVGIPRPDPRLHYVQSQWGKLSEKTKDDIASEVKKYTSE